MTRCEISCPAVGICDKIINYAVGAEQDNMSGHESGWGDFPAPRREEAVANLEWYLAVGNIPTGTHIEGYNNATQMRAQILNECSGDGPKITRKYRFFGKVSVDCQSALPPKGF